VEDTKKQTIQDRGPLLPIGIASGGKLHQGFDVRPWRFKEERELGRLREDNKGANLAQYVSVVLATMCTRMGPHDFTQMSENERLLAVGQMYMADVFYAYVWLRIQSLGNEFTIKFQPANAPEPLNIVTDLNTIEVDSVDELEQTFWEYELKAPCRIRGKTAIGFKMGAPRWDALERAPKLGTDSGAAKLAVLLGSVAEIRCENSEPIVTALAPDELDELTKRDIETVTALMDKNNLGPDMSVEGKHKGRPFRVSIDWGYDNFFSISSV